MRERERERERERKDREGGMRRERNEGTIIIYKIKLLFSRKLFCKLCISDHG